MITKRASAAFASLPPISVADLEARVGPVYWFALGFEHPERPLRSEAGQVESVLAVGDYARPRGDSDAWNRVETVSEDRTWVKLSSGWRGDPALLEKQPANRLECDESRNPIIRSGDLVLGKRYRIVEILRQDRSPSHALGDVLRCAAAGSAIRPRKLLHDSWFASDGEQGTWVTAVQRVEDEPEQPLRCEHGFNVAEPCPTCGENSVQRTSAYGVALNERSPIIRAAEGVALESDEYEMLDGRKLFVTAAIPATTLNATEWCWVIDGAPGEIVCVVTAVRRIETVAAPLVEPGEHPHPDGTVLHKLWGLAHDAPGYDKEGWKTLQRELRSTDTSELRAKVRELETEVSRAGVQRREALVEELQQIDDAVVAAGGTRDRGPAAFIRDLKAELTARDSEIARHADELRGHTNHCAEAIQAERRAVAEIKAESIAKDSEIARLREGLQSAELQVRTVINRDQSGLAAGLLHVKAIAQGYMWIPENHWGSYEADAQCEAVLREETGNLIRGVVDGCMRYLRASGKRAEEAARFRLEAPPTEASEPAPRPILVGSTWRENCTGAEILRRVHRTSSDGKTVTTLNSGLYEGVWTEHEFLDCHSHVSDPAPSEVAPVTGSGQ